LIQSVDKERTDHILVAVGVVILCLSAQSAADHALFYKKTDNGVNTDARQHRWAWLSQIFSDASDQIRFWLRTRSISHRSIYICQILKKNALLIDFCWAANVQQIS